MKNIFFIFIFLLILIVSCNEDDTLWSNGVITGEDMRMCACCGGWFINIDSSKYMFYDLPNNTSLKLDPVKYPLNVILQWSKRPLQCLGDEITILQIKKK